MTASVENSDNLTDSVVKRLVSTALISNELENYQKTIYTTTKVISSFKLPMKIKKELSIDLFIPFRRELLLRTVPSS